MKKSSKGLILLGTAAIAISMGGTSQLTTQINSKPYTVLMQMYKKKIYKPIIIIQLTYWIMFL